MRWWGSAEGGFLGRVVKRGVDFIQMLSIGQWVKENCAGFLRCGRSLEYHADDVAFGHDESGGLLINGGGADGCCGERAGFARGMQGRLRNVFHNGR